MAQALLIRCPDESHSRAACQSSIDAYLGIHARALSSSRGARSCWPTNLANADTPGFKARDIDFRSALAAAGNTAVRLPAARRHDAAAELKYRVPMAPALDGNTVDAQLEQAAFAENAVRYQATLTCSTASCAA